MTRSETGFTMCVDMPADAWDSTYVKGFGRLFTPGACVEKVVIGCDGDKRADVRVFSQSGYLWRGKNKGKDGSYAKPAKIDPGQVDVYMAHEAVATFGKDLQNPKVVREFDYVGYFDQKRSAIWWPFGPSLDSMAEDFPAYTIPHSERIPAVAWIAIDCLPPRPGIIVGLAEHFPTFSMGNCFNNYHLPRNLPGRGVENLEYQSKMARYMFYFAMENAPMCEGYMTEKVWMALARGSIPIYTGHDSFTELMPTKKSYIDLRDYDSFEALAAELEASKLRSERADAALHELREQLQKSEDHRTEALQEAASAKAESPAPVAIGMIIKAHATTKPIKVAISIFSPCWAARQ